MDPSQPQNLQHSEGDKDAMKTSTEAITQMALKLTQMGPPQRRTDNATPFVDHSAKQVAVDPPDHPPSPHMAAGQLPLPRPTLSQIAPPTMSTTDQTSDSQTLLIEDGATLEVDTQTAENMVQTSPDAQAMPPRMDLSVVDGDIIRTVLTALTDIHQGLEESLPPPEKTFEHFGETIADILRKQSEILDACQLRQADEGLSGPESRRLDAEKLETMAQAAAKLFENVTNVSQEMHEVTDKLPPFYTRYMAYFRNLEVKAGNTASFSHTVALEAAISQHLVRLQNELLNKATQK
ncbi:hypothetical protein X943_001201 [Babesia divergens]|uniref:Uncharacterized protein n=1 Tax=Babesia divergens TaxID=32595 RepID=A0AAD9GKA9_BABDI|nr:hypothetical protein X943_001201 [Babesia divergens]